MNSRGRSSRTPTLCIEPIASPGRPRPQAAAAQQQAATDDAPAGDNPTQRHDTFTWTPANTLQSLALVLLMPLAMLVAAGKRSWPQAWIIVLTQAAGWTLAMRHILRVNPGLIAERKRMTQQPNVAAFDKVCMPALLALTPLIYLAAGLQHRLSAPVHFSLAWQLAAFLLFVASIALEAWCVIANRWYSSVVRLQTDRAHRLVQGGPYRYLRHPSYTGFALQSVAECVLLESSWAAWVAAVRGIVLLVRTAQEDAWLHRNLAGYVGYASRVRCKLVPYVW